MRWYASPIPTEPDSNDLAPADRPAMLVDAYGQYVADFQRLADAEEVADLHNSIQEPWE